MGNDLRYSLRSLARSPLFTIAAIVTIALGVGVGSAMFEIVDAILIRPLPYGDSDRLVGMWHNLPGLNNITFPQAPGTYYSYRREATRSFEAIGAYSPAQFTVSYADRSVKPERIDGGRVSASLFTLLHTRPIAGRVLSDADEQVGAVQVAVISESFWHSRFGGDTAIVGRRIAVNGVESTIVGVMPTSLAFPSAETRLWLPLGAEGPSRLLGSFTFGGIARLRPGVTVDAATSELAAILSRTYETYPEQRAGMPTKRFLDQSKIVPVLHPLRDDVIGGFEQILWLVAGTVGVLIIVAGSNVASLMLVRIDARRRELAVRASLGATRSNLLTRLATEAAVLAVAGGLAGFVVGAEIISIFRRGDAVFLPRLNEVGVNGPFFLVVTGLTALFAIVGIAIGASRTRVAQAFAVLREGGRLSTGGRGGQRARGMFVVVQVALSLALLSGTLVLTRSMARMRAIPIGFSADDAYTFWTSLPRVDYRTGQAVAQFYRDAAARLEQLPGVTNVGVVSKLPLVGGAPVRVVLVEDRPAPQGTIAPTFPITQASAGYFAALRIPVIAGRAFDDDAVRAGQLELVVSRAFAVQFWSDSTGRAALGRRVRPSTDSPWYTIVGVVNDIRDMTLTGDARASVYLSQEAGPDATLAWQPSPTMAFVVRTRGPVSGLSAAIDRTIQNMDPGLPAYRATLMTQIVSDTRRYTEFAFRLLAAGALSTLLLGVVGLYGVIAFVVNLRSREIGIRIALGLQPSRATTMILGQGSVIVALGAAAGLAVYIASARLLESVAFGVRAIDALSIAAATGIVLFIAAVATWIPASRAARVDPMEALRSD